jgi:hypothetical protein
MIHSDQFISEHRATFGVAFLCRGLDVRPPGFYEWLAAAPTGAEAQAAGEHACGTGSCSALTGWSPATVNALSGLS